MSEGSELQVVRASRIRPRPEGETPWLIEDLWGAEACGVLGGAPKSFKSWLSLEMAVAVASGQPCLGRYPVPQAGPVLVFAAEDTPLQVRERLEGLSSIRGADFETLPVGLIVEPHLRIDRPEDVARLKATLVRTRPKLLVLDPYVRLQRVEENSSTEVSQVLGTLSELSRTCRTAIALVHHARKGAADHAGLSLRGSSDFHAWGSSNLYLWRRGEDLTLSVEHRAAASPPPVTLRLVSDDGPVRLEVQPSRTPEEPATSLADRVLEALNGSGPKRQEELRAILQIRNQRLTEILHQLERDNQIHRLSEGWVRLPRP